MGGNNFRSLIIFLFSVSIFFNGCSRKRPLIKQRELLMNTVAEITVYRPEDKPAVAAAFNAIKDIEKLASRFLPASELNKINANAGRVPVKVNDILFDMIEMSVHFSKMSDGAFDITVGPVVSLWSIGTKQSIPRDKEIREKLKLVSYKNIVLDRAKKTVFLKNTGMQIDLGGVAKGYAVDRAIEVLKGQQVARAMVQLGGEIGFLGQPPSGKFRNIGIQHPRDNKKIIALMSITDEQVSTSGDYFRYFVHNGVRYHHILDPHNGYPARGCQAVTVITDKKSDADILATTVFVLGPEKGMNLIESLPGTGCVIVTADGRILISKEMKQKIRMM